MDGEVAVQKIREACYALADSIGLESPLETYGTHLEEQYRRSFPDVNGDSSVPMLGAKFQHVMHWILFGAGVRIEYRGKNGEQKDVVVKDGFNPRYVEREIRKHRPHIKALARYA